MRQRECSSKVVARATGVCTAAWPTLGRWFFLPLLLALALSITSALAAPPDVPGLFKDPGQPVNVSRHGRAATAGELDTGPLARGLEKLSLELPDGETIVMLRDALERRGPGDLAWRGHVDGDDSSQVVLTLKNGFVFGSIQYGDAEYEIRAGRAGEHVIEEIDPESRPGDKHLQAPEGAMVAPDPSLGAAATRMNLLVT